MNGNAKHGLWYQKKKKKNGVLGTPLLLHGVCTNTALANRISVTTATPQPHDQRHLYIGISITRAHGD